MAINFIMSRAISSLRRDPAVMLGTSSIELSVVVGLNFDHSKAASHEELAVNEIKMGSNRARIDDEIIWRASARPLCVLFPRRYLSGSFRHRFLLEHQPGVEASPAPFQHRHPAPPRAMRSIPPADERPRKLPARAAGERSRGCEQPPRYATV